MMRPEAMPSPAASSRRAPLLLCAALAALAAACGGGAPAAPAPAPREALPAGADTVTLHLLGTTDVHGRLYPWDYYQGTATDHGLALLAPLVDSVRAAHPGRVFLFDSGDWLQGNPLAFVYGRLRAEEGSPIIRAMNLLGYDAAAIGNHEYNYGIPHLEAARAQADFPLLSGNTFQPGSPAHAFQASALLPHVVSEGDTLLVGVTAATPPGVHIWDRANVEGRLEFRDISASLAPVVADLRRRGADLVVVLAHSGLEGSSYDVAATGVAPENEAAELAHEVPGIDVILVGHSHREMADTTINGVLLSQPRNWARSLAEVRVVLGRRDAGEWAPLRKTGRIHQPDPAHADTAFLDSLRWAHERTVAWVSSEVGRASEAMSARESRVRDTPFLDFINEVQRQAAGADLSAAAAFSLGAEIPEGPVTIADVAGAYIYDNTLKAVRVTGAQLRAYLEKAAEYYRTWPPEPGEGLVNPEVPGYNFDVVSGVEYVIDLSRPLGQRITQLTYEGRPVESDQTFTLALNNYRQGGGGGFSMLEDAPVVYDRQEEIRDLLLEEIRRRGTIRPEDYFRQSWRLEPAAAAAAAHEEQLSARDARGGVGESAAAPAPAGKRLRVLATNDFHGTLLPETPAWADGRLVGGAAALATYFRMEGEGFAGPTALLDGGDMYQGSPISNLTEGRSTIDYYNAAGYTAAALGNHEFDWGVATLAARAAQARYPFLAANVFYEGTDSVPPWIRPTALVRVGSGLDTVTLGIVGIATPETPQVTRWQNVEGLEFREPAAAIDRWVPELRERADFVVVVAHEGAFCERPAHAVCEGDLVEVAERVTRRPDLIVGGHTHSVVATHVNGIAMVEAATRGQRYGVVDLFRAPGDSMARAWIRGVPLAWTDAVPADSGVAALVARYQAEIGPRVNRVIATAATALDRRGGEYPLGRLIADAQRRAADTEVAIMNNGGIRTAIDAGPITWTELFLVQPFENRVVRQVLTGAQLRAALEHGISGREPNIHVSGITVHYDPSRPAGSRILSARLDDGSSLREDETYTVAVNDFMAGGGSGFSMLTGALASEETGIVDLDALVTHLEALPQPVRPPEEDRLRPVGEREVR